MSSVKDTMGGYRFDEVVSALQKEIRRGNEREAMHWALELAHTDAGTLWRRLIVITNEDIGLAEPEIFSAFNALHDMWQKLVTAKSKDRYIVLANAIMLLARAPKSREADHFKICALHWQKSNPPEIPDYALDKHTSRGRAKGRGDNHFFRKGAQLHEPQSVLGDRYEEAAMNLILNDTHATSRRVPDAPPGRCEDQADGDAGGPEPAPTGGDGDGSVCQ